MTDQSNETLEYSENQSHIFFISNLKRLAQIISYIIILLNILAAINTFSPIPFGNNIFVTNPFIALSFIVIQAAFLIKFEEKISFLNAAIGNTFSIVIFVFGILILSDYFMASEFVKYLFLTGTNNYLVAHYGFIFLTLGITLITFNTPLITHARVYQWLTLIAGIFPLFSLLEYIYKTFTISLSESWITLPFVDAIFILLTCLSFLLARPNHGVLRILTTPLKVSTLALRLVIVTILIPILLGYFTIIALQLNFFTIQIAIILLVLSYIIIFTSLIWWVTNLLYKDDIEKIKASELLKTQTLELEETGKKLSNKVEELEKAKEEIKKLLLYQDKVRNMDT